MLFSPPSLIRPNIFPFLIFCFAILHNTVEATILGNTGLLVVLPALAAGVIARVRTAETAPEVYPLAKACLNIDPVVDARS